MWTSVLVTLGLVVGLLVVAPLLVYVVVKVATVAHYRGRVFCERLKEKANGEETGEKGEA